MFCFVLDMMRTEKNNVVDAGKKFFSENKSSGQYSYPEWNKDVIPPVSSWDISVVLTK